MSRERTDASAHTLGYGPCPLPRGQGLLPLCLLRCVLLVTLLVVGGCATQHSPSAQSDTRAQSGPDFPSGPDSPSGHDAQGTAQSAKALTPALHYTADFVYATPPPTPSAAAPAAREPSANAPAAPAPAQGVHAVNQPPPELLHALRAASLLLKLKDSPPDDAQGLEFRVDKDEAEALRLLHAFGYYDGAVHRTLRLPDAPASPGTPSAPQGSEERDTGVTENTGRPPAPSRPARSYGVTLALLPGTRYTVGESVVHYANNTAAPATAQTPTGLPQTLEAVGLTRGAPAEAARLLSAVERVPELLRQRGYPLAEVKTTRYAVDKSTKQLFATVLVQAGPRARMGRVLVRGDSAVNSEYVEKLRTWKEGTLWNQQRVDNYRDRLVRQGLFRSIEVTPSARATADTKTANSVSAPNTHAGTNAETNAETTGTTAAHSTPAALTIADTIADAATANNPLGSSPSPTPVYDLLVTVADAPQRTVGGGLNYESNRGFGAQASWEHRNLLGQGERFRAEATLWQDSQFARATFRKPAFLDHSQELTAEGWLRNEDTDAYTQRAAWLSVGLERRLWGPLFASAGVSLEGGDLEDPTHPRRGYTMTSVPLNVRYEGSGGAAQLNPERGIRASLGVRPTWGYYGDSFTVLPTRLALSAYWPWGAVGTYTEGPPIPRVVLAARGAAGTLWRGDSQRIPAAARYYGGGGGSVRGYAYQSLGPQDGHGNPLGGASFAELSLEARVRITENIAVVPFLDGGNVYSGVTPGFERDGTSTGMQWGAGLGLRYHTAVGPLRLDVATPLNPRKDDGPLFLYISIGQSF